jgi:FixJ family two-component response regulator
MIHGPLRFIVAAVDDDQSVLRSLAYLLESADYSARLFTSGAALLDSGCLAEIDCLISDVNMPGTDGVELLRVVRSARDGLPVILITGYPDTVKRLPPSDDQYQRVFVKPFQGLELLTAVGEAIRAFRA